MKTVDSKKVGDIVLVKDDIGNPSEFIVIQKGLPSSKYDAACDGIWLMRKYAIGPSNFSSISNNYSGSALYLALSYYYPMDTDLKKVARYAPTLYYDTSSSSGGSFETRGSYAFSFSAGELGFTASDNANLPVIGTQLNYFKTKANRICYLKTGQAVDYWLRCPVKGTTDQAFYLTAAGALATASIKDSHYLRPVLIVDPSVPIDDNNLLLANIAPVITSSLSGDRGTLTNGFTVNYSVDDTDAADALTVTLTLDSRTVQSFSGVRKRQETYTLGGTDWLKLTNGKHTFNIMVNDGTETTTHTITFTRNCTSLDLTLLNPLQTGSPISKMNLKLVGNIPSDAILTAEASNNALDAQPVWEDITARVKSGLNHVFENKTFEQGSAFNFKISLKRGTTNTGGFIEKVICEYE